MSKISAVILTKDSENMIADCINSVAFCDEIIVIDDNSSDRTSDLAKHLGAKVYTDKNSETDFSLKREFGLKKASGTWIFYIDADERVDEELKESIINVSNQRKPEFNAYKITRRNYYLGSHEWPAVEQLERFFKKNTLKGWYGKIHETPKYEGNIGTLSGFLLHFTHSDLTSMVNKTISWSKTEAELRLKANHPKMTWWRFPRVMLTSFFEYYIKQKGYKAGTAGLIESIYQSFSIFITYARLWELQQKSPDESKSKQL